jgi:hypothetical protein
MLLLLITYGMRRDGAKNEQCRPQALQPQPVHLKALRLPNHERRMDLADAEHGALAIDDLCL